MIPNTMAGGQRQLTEADVKRMVTEELKKENNNG
jgi:hypothetical protein